MASLEEYLLEMAVTANRIEGAFVAPAYLVGEVHQLRWRIAEPEMACPHCEERVASPPSAGIDLECPRCGDLLRFTL